MSSVSIDCFVDSLAPYPRDATVVAVDVIRSTTTAITAVAGGRRCHVVPTLEEAMRMREVLDEPLLVGELGGNMPFGFDLNNSPAAMADLPADGRQAILLSSSGTRLMTLAAERYPTTRVACLRNWRAEAQAIAAWGSETVVLVGAGTRGEFREEDQLCCAWIAERLVQGGFHASGATAELIERWTGATPDAIRPGKSAQYLVASGQLADLEFVLEHVADIDATFAVRGTEVILAEDGGGPMTAHG
jgi:2-phosphosulfolactate phosphatase